MRRPSGLMQSRIPARRSHACPGMSFGLAGGAAERVVGATNFGADVVARRSVVVVLGLVVVTAAAFEAWRRDVGLPPAPPTEAEPELGRDVPEPEPGDLREPSGG